MLTPKAKMRVNLAVEDYQKMFSDEYKDLLKVIQGQRDNLENEMAEIKHTHALKRGLATYSEKLYQMIMAKLSDKEQEEFKSLEGQRWFATEHPAFRLSKHV